MKFVIQCNHCLEDEIIEEEETDEGKEDMSYFIRALHFPFLCDICRKAWKEISESHNQELLIKKNKFCKE